jgi:lipid II:glycine glycyltransferase (peptidoglycan interpeptide bridge formation enzyme)
VIKFVIKEYAAKEWSGLTAEFLDMNLMQCWEYGQAKAQTSSWQIERGIFVNGDQIIGATQVFIRRLPLGLPGGIAWINRGPLCQNLETDVVLAMLAELRRYYVQERGLYLRVAPSLNEEAGLEKAAASISMKSTGSLGWASANLDLTPPTEEIRANLNAKWRGHVNKSERSNFVVKSGSAEDLFQSFVKNHRELIEERGFKTTVTPELLQALQDAFDEKQKMRIYLAYIEGELVASTLMVRYGNVCEYLAGNLAPAGRKFGTGQGLLWQAIVDMKELGCVRLDVSGMDPIATPKGIYDFKNGLKPEPYRMSGELEANGWNIFSLIVCKYVEHVRSMN